MSMKIGPGTGPNDCYLYHGNTTITDSTLVKDNLVDNKLETFFLVIKEAINIGKEFEEKGLNPQGQKIQVSAWEALENFARRKKTEIEVED